jgi:hypothetical protein
VVHNHLSDRSLEGHLMFDLGPVEVGLLVLMAAGVVIPLAAGLARRIPRGAAVLAVVLTLLVPAIGSVAAILITILRWQPQPHRPADAASR